jgi:hypothetical protein
MFKKRTAILIISSVAFITAISAGAAYAKNTNGNIPKTGGPGNNMQGGPGGRMGGEKIDQGTIGKVTAISGTTITMEGGKNAPPDNSTTGSTITYTVDASGSTFTKESAPSAPATNTKTTKTTKITEGNQITNTTITITDIKINDMIRVNGTVNGTSITAKTTTLMSFQNNGQGADPMIIGTVTANNGTTLTITSQERGRPKMDTNNNAATATTTTYTVNTSSATVKKSSASTNGNSAPSETTITVADIVVGDTIRVQGTISGTSITATTIIDDKTNSNPSKNGGNTNLNKLVDNNSEAAALKTEVETAKTGLWSKVMSFFSRLINKR